MVTVNDNVLDSMLLEFVNDCKKKSLQAYNTFGILYYSGFRISEIINLDVLDLNNGTFVMQPLKNNNIRTLSYSEFPLDFRDIIKHSTNVFLFNSVSSAQHFFSNHWKYKTIFHKTKNVASHLFRHNYAKKLKNQGLTDGQIQLKLGEKQLSSAQNYIYSILQK